MHTVVIDRRYGNCSTGSYLLLSIMTTEGLQNDAGKSHPTNILGYTRNKYPCSVSMGLLQKQVQRPSDRTDTLAAEKVMGTNTFVLTDKVDYRTSGHTLVHKKLVMESTHRISYGYGIPYIPHVLSVATTCSATSGNIQHSKVQRYLTTIPRRLQAAQSGSGCNPISATFGAEPHTN